MCVSVITKDGKDIGHVKELLAEFPNIELVKYRAYDVIDPECCFCQLDLKATMQGSGLQYTCEYDGADYELL